MENTTPSNRNPLDTAINTLAPIKPEEDVLKHTKNANDPRTIAESLHAISKTIRYAMTELERHLGKYSEPETHAMSNNNEVSALMLHLTAPFTRDGITRHERGHSIIDLMANGGEIKAAIQQVRASIARNLEEPDHEQNPLNIKNNPNHRATLIIVISRAIEIARKLLSLTQADVGIAAGIGQGTVSNTVRHQPVRMDALVKLGQWLDTKRNELQRILNDKSINIAPMDREFLGKYFEVKNDKNRFKELTELFSLDELETQRTLIESLRQPRKKHIRAAKRS